MVLVDRKSEMANNVNEASEEDIKSVQDNLTNIPNKIQDDDALF